MAKYMFLDSGAVKYAFQRAPQVFADEFTQWERKERTSYLGPKTSDMNRLRASGKALKGFRGKLRQKSLLGRPGEQWSPQVAGQFKTYMEHKDTLNVKTTMGLTKDNRISRALDFLSRGGTISSGKYIPIPAFTSLRKFGVTGNFKQKFEEWSDDKQLFAVKPKNNPGKIYWMRKAYNDVTLAFVGQKQIRVRKQFDFAGPWRRRLPSVLARGQKSADRATRKVLAMIRRGDILG